MKAIENLKIVYQEEITSKWSSEKEREIYSIKYDTLLELEKEMKK